MTTENIIRGTHEENTRNSTINTINTNNTNNKNIPNGENWIPDDKPQEENVPHNEENWTRNNEENWTHNNNVKYTKWGREKNWVPTENYKNWKYDNKNRENWNHDNKNRENWNHDNYHNNYRNNYNIENRDNHNAENRNNYNTRNRDNYNTGNRDNYNTGNRNNYNRNRDNYRNNYNIGNTGNRNYNIGNRENPDIPNRENPDIPNRENSDIPNRENSIPPIHDDSTPNHENSNQDSNNEHYKFQNIESTNERINKIPSDVLKEIKICGMKTFFGIFLKKLNTICIALEKTLDVLDTQRMWTNIVYNMCVSFNNEYLRDEMERFDRIENIATVYDYVQSISIFDSLQLLVDLARQNCHDSRYDLDDISTKQNITRQEFYDVETRYYLMRDLYFDFMELYRHCTGTWKPKKFIRQRRITRSRNYRM